MIEVFPTASWTRWHGKRGRQTRASWTRQALTALGLLGVPARTNQDQRDAIAAAMTARQHAAGTTETIGEIVVLAACGPGRRTPVARREQPRPTAALSAAFRGYRSRRPPQGVRGRAEPARAAAAGLV